MPKNNRSKKQQRTRRRGRKTKTGRVRILAGDTCGQGQSPFFRLPQEVRDMIYPYLFDDTIYPGHDSPKLNYLALLRTCRRTYREIGDTWLDYTMVDFGKITTMLDVLTSNQGTRSRIRLITVAINTLMLSEDLVKHDVADEVTDLGVYYRLVAVFKLLPGLCLDRLVVIDKERQHPMVSYDILNGLITEGCGWKELHYIAPHSGILSYGHVYELDPDPNRPRFLRMAQPMYWQKVLKDRDGADSEPSVHLYRIRRCRGIDTYDKVKQTVPEVMTEQEFAYHVDRSLMRADLDGNKGYLFVIRRGAHVDYREKRKPPPLAYSSDIRLRWPKMTWAQIKRRCVTCSPTREREVENPVMPVSLVSRTVWTAICLNDLVVSTFLTCKLLAQSVIS